MHIYTIKYIYNYVIVDVKSIKFALYSKGRIQAAARWQHQDQLLYSSMTASDVINSRCPRGKKHRAIRRQHSDEGPSPKGKASFRGIINSIRESIDSATTTTTWCFPHKSIWPIIPSPHAYHPPLPFLYPFALRLSSAFWPTFFPPCLPSFPVGLECRVMFSGRAWSVSGGKRSKHWPQRTMTLWIHRGSWTHSRQRTTQPHRAR